MAHEYRDLLATAAVVEPTGDPNTGTTAGKVTVTFGNTPFDTFYYGTPVTSLTYHGDGYEMWLSRSPRAGFDLAAFIAAAEEQYRQNTATLDE